MSSYFDHAATTPMRPEAIEAFVEHADLVGNPASLHRLGQRARRALEEAREELAAAVGAHPTEVIFTSGGSEADSIAVLGCWAARSAEGRPRCLISAIEHPAVAGAANRGAEVLPVARSGEVDVAAAGQQIDENVGVVSVLTVNNETGVIQPIEQLRKMAVRAGAWLHTDAVQALGHIPVDFAASRVDLMSLSAHKIGGPVGIGALLAQRSVSPQPIGLGGGQERAVRSGTNAVALAASFARAASLAVDELAGASARLTALRDRIADIAIGVGAASTLAPTARPHRQRDVRRRPCRRPALFYSINAGIHASVGSACRAGVHQPSEVLIAMGRTVDERRSRRASPSGAPPPTPTSTASPTPFPSPSPRPAPPTDPASLTPCFPSKPALRAAQSPARFAQRWASRVGA